MKKTYNLKIKMYRELRNFTQEYVAFSIGISQRAYSSIENGQTQLTVKRLFEIAKVLQIDVKDIIYNDNEINETKFDITNYNELKKLYDKLIESKENEIETLKELLKNKPK